MKNLTASIVLLGAALATPVLAGEAPATVYRGGTIITMDGDLPRIAQAVTTRGDRIAFVGDEGDARAVAGRDAVVHELRGATMLPGFVDAHSHFSAMMSMTGGLDLSDKSAPPVIDIPSLQGAIRDFIARRAIPKGEWVVVWQYDNERLAGKNHITRAELDAVSPGHKIVVWHQSLHALVANSGALAAAKLTDTSQPPPGGIILRDVQGRLNGVLFENAAFMMAMAMPKPDEEQRLLALDAAQQRYFAKGYTHAQDGATMPEDLGFLTGGAVRNRLKIDLAILPFFTGIDKLLADPDARFGEYRGHVKLQGIKFVLDGSVQARTGFFTRDYARGSPDGAHPWHGQANLTDETFLAAARKVNDRGWQIFAHANGDAAIDMAIRTFDALGIKADDDRRPIVIHSQFQRPDQLADYKRIGVGPAYFTNHTWYWADVHRTNFPREVVDFISPLKSASAAGLIVSNHSDFPVTPIDPMFMLWTSMARISPTGVVSGADERVDVYAGLQALTSGPTWQVFEENRKGRIKAGLLADFVILGRNPLVTPVDAIRGIQVLETVKAGESVWRVAAE